MPRATTSQKHNCFVQEPMGDKDVYAVAGIGTTYGYRLASQGFDKAYTLLGQFLILRMNQAIFLEWLRITCDASSYHGIQCYNCLLTWCKNFL